MIKIVVSTEEEKQQLLGASVHLFYCDEANERVPMVSTLIRLHHTPWLIEVDPDLK